VKSISPIVCCNPEGSCQRRRVIVELNGILCQEVMTCRLSLEVWQFASVRPPRFHGIEGPPKLGPRRFNTSEDHTPMEWLEVGE
jgi:hypothetical protein